MILGNSLISEITNKINVIHIKISNNASNINTPKYNQIARTLIYRNVHDELRFMLNII
jgi:hypothetical protein